MSVIAYVFLFVLFQSIVAQRMVYMMNDVVGLGLFLLIFCFSALFCGLVTLAYPVFLASKKKWKDAFSVIGWMAFWIAGVIGSVLLFFIALVSEFSSF